MSEYGQSGTSPVRIFLSYATPNVAIVHLLKRALERQKAFQVECWFAPEEVLPGQGFAGPIHEGVRHADLFLLVLSGATFESVHVPKEVALAVERRCPLLVYQVEELESIWEADPTLGYWLADLRPFFDATRDPGGGYIDAFVNHVVTKALPSLLGPESRPHESSHMDLSIPRLEGIPPFWTHEDQVDLEMIGVPDEASWHIEGLARDLRWEPIGRDGDLTRARIRGVPAHAARELRIAVSRRAGSPTTPVPFSVPLRFASTDDYCEVKQGWGLCGYQQSPGTAVILNSLHQRFTDIPSGSQLSAHFASREVFVPSFYIKRTPVTNDEYKRFVKETGHRLPSHWTDPDHWFPPQLSDHPVTNVTHSDAEEYCHWRGTRLPTAVEWEKAARGSEGRLYPWGDEFNQLRCNTSEQRLRSTSGVWDHEDGCSPCGALDMAGNVAERVDAGRIAIDNNGICVLHRTLRGGSFRDAGILYSMTFMESREDYYERVVFDPTNGHAQSLDEHQGDWIGFRDVLDVPFWPPAQSLIALPQVAYSAGPKGSRQVMGTFAMSRFAVSNLEYLEFVLAESHQRPSHWQGGDHPFSFDERHHPVTNVSQADATSFCHWKTRCSEDHVKFRLPRPQEWERAVRGAADHPQAGSFPWGSRYDAWRCNASDSNYGHLIGVFGLPEGQSQDGLYNLCGNVYEWLSAPGYCAGSSWRSPSPQKNLPWQRTLNRAVSDGDTGFRYVASLKGR